MLARVKAHVQIRMMQQELKKTNDELESRVKQRTSELERTYYELQHTFKKLVDSENMYRTLLEAAPDAVILASDQGVIELVNKETSKLFGYSEDELLGQSVEMLIPLRFENHISLREKYMQHPDARSLVSNSGLFAARKDGSEFPADISLSPIETDGHRRIIVDIRDITDREQLYEQLQQSQKMEAIGHLTGGIAHDFNNMLASIMGFTQLAIDLSESIHNEKLDDYLQEINRAGERARDLVAQMLSYSRRTPGKKFVPLELPVLIKEVVMMIRPMLPSSIEINYDFDEDVPMVKVDPVRLHQVLMNLCINARDAIGGHGRIDLLLASANVKNKLCSSCHELISGDFVGIKVSDNGSGIVQDNIRNIFDPFFTTKEVGKGTGMGLSVVHGIMHDHHGHIVVDSVPGQGTEINLLFPSNEEEKNDE